jgi:hypothetical protein
MYESGDSNSVHTPQSQTSDRVGRLPEDQSKSSSEQSCFAYSCLLYKLVSLQATNVDPQSNDQVYVSVYAKSSHT